MLPESPWEERAGPGLRAALPQLEGTGAMAAGTRAAQGPGILVGV